MLGSWNPAADSGLAASAAAASVHAAAASDNSFAETASALHQRHNPCAPPALSGAGDSRFNAGEAVDMDLHLSWTAVMSVSLVSGADSDDSDW